MMKIHVLGCNGWIPGKNETSCFLVEENNTLIMLDAGTGVVNIRKYTDILAKYDSISIVLSHYHLDHLIGLIYLLPYIKNLHLNIYGPGIPIYSKTTLQYLEEFLQPIFFSTPILKFTSEVNCFDYEGKDFYIGSVSLKVKQQKHSVPSFRITIDDKLVYATDTSFDPSEWQNCRNNITLLHECWEINGQCDNKHTSLKSLISGLPKNMWQSTCLIHLNPEWGEDDYRRISELIDGTGMKVCYDGMLLTI